MYTKQALRELGVPSGSFTSAQQDALDKQGFFVVPGVFSREDCLRMGAEFDRLSSLEHGQGGHEVHVEPGAPRVSNIFNKTEVYDSCLNCAPLLAAAHYLLGEVKLHGANLREPNKGQGHQSLHTDVPKKFDDDWWVLNALVLFDDMTLTNGPTRMIPGSHHWAPLNVAHVNMGDWVPQPLSAEDQARVPADLAAPYTGEIYLTAPAGSVAIMNSSVWHGGTRNTDGERRRVLHLTYTRRDLAQQLTQRDYVTEALYERMSPAQRFLMDIEPLGASDVVIRQPEKPKNASWWN
ncbi:phytanoyl-CoA dioxygenase family protein [Acidisoma silvae]|uniref:Phytanoyl-CoA dioxygenase family protein n=1 Tax=Acidisoma silvae TaxID=2802396 RepID=A0A964DXI1_9PROT|nr:phytanoyl-CoA dioxygenase family protein [Acidisoma silvae]MCB8874231.1 phytanoyl-CoA dioxygenase family protein [Acidisoma silvae]